jgi:hypothetical protein
MRGVLWGVMLDALRGVALYEMVGNMLCGSPFHY